MRGAKSFPQLESFPRRKLSTNAAAVVLLMDEPNGVCGNLIKSGKFVINKERNEDGGEGSADGSREKRKKN